jgi:hypothetical protein
MFGIFKLFGRKPTTEVDIDQKNKIKSLNTTSEGQFKKPGKKQLEECERYGLTINPNMNSHEVWQFIENAKKDPQIKKIHDDYIAAQNAIYETVDREEYGDAIVDEQKKYTNLCLVGVHHIVVFKKGKTLGADIIEFESVNIEGDNKHYVKVDGLRPKIYKPRGESPYIEWEKEISFRPNQILEIITLPEPIDMFELKDYQKALDRAEKLKEKYVKIC